MKIQKLNESNDSKYITDEIASKTNSQEIKDAIDKNNLSVLVRDNTWYTEKCPNGLGKALKDEMKKLYPDLKHMYGESTSLKTFGAKGKKLKESSDGNITFKIGDTFDYSGLYGGTQHCKVINVTDDYIECKVNWTSEDDGKDVNDTTTFKLDTDSEGNQCAIVWEYSGEVGRVYPNDAKKLGEDYEPLNKGEWVEYNLSVKKDVKHIIPVKVDVDLGKEFYGWAWAEGYHKYDKSRIVSKIDMTDTDEIIRKYTNEDLNEASYGGAFDIEDSQFFTREDIDNFAEEVLNHINETFEEQFDISGAYITDGVIELEITNETLGDFSCNKAIDMRKVKEPWHLKRAYATDCAADLINQIKEVSNMFESINESTTENARPIEAGAKVGIASIINSLIVSEYAAIEEYNSAIATAREEGFENIAKVLTDIQAEENVHVGQLQELMKLVDPNAVKVEEGKSEGAEQLSDTFNDDDDVFDFFTSDDVEIGNEDDIDDDEVETFIKKVKESMEQKSLETSIDMDELEEEVIVESTEPWEDIYKSFKDIEVQLKGDGEAITATIDKLYQDNKHNPDFKKAYDKWASNE